MKMEASAIHEQQQKHKQQELVGDTSSVVEDLCLAHVQTSVVTTVFVEESGTTSCVWEGYRF